MAIMKFNTTIFALAIALAFIVWPSRAGAAGDPVKVILMSGQSNMVGHGKVEWGLNPAYNADPDNQPREIKSYYDTNTNQWVLGIGSLREMVVNNPGTFGHGGTNPLVGPDVNGVPGSGNWLVRNDVHIHSETNTGTTSWPSVDTGGHTVGFGRGSSPWFGPEYGLGQVVGNAVDQDVIIVKVAWGGKSLDVDFASPTAAARRGVSVGAYWTSMVSDMNRIVADLGTTFPQYSGRDFDITGFAWHQGYNDRVDGNGAPSRYEQNMADFITDVRTVFGDDLPFIIANTGMGNIPEGSNADLVVDAQMAMADFNLYPEHEGNVAVVDTRPMYRDITESPSTQGHHWNHNGITHYMIGAGMGEAYLSLVPEPSSLLLLAASGLALAVRRRRQ